MTAHILVVDDDPVERKQIKNALEHFGYAITLCSGVDEALQCLKDSGSEIDAVLVDLNISRGDDGECIHSITQIGHELPVVVQTGQGGIQQIVTAMQAGAFDFIVKPASNERLAAVLSSALTVSQASKVRRTRKMRTGGVNFTSIISASQAMIRVTTLARKAAHNLIPIVVEGEHGVGKEMIARAIHSGSERSARPFVVMRCAALGSNSAGTLRSKAVEAHGGTLMLDELSGLTLDAQALLVDLVEKDQIDLGEGSAPKRLNVRIISTSTKDLIGEVRSGRFREDLYYRLNVSPIVIPALRRRIEDIPQLARMYAEQFATELRKGSSIALSSKVLALLTAYDWPGNVSQLENALYRAIALSKKGELTVADFSHITDQMSASQQHLQLGSVPELIVSNNQRTGGTATRLGDSMREGQSFGADKSAGGDFRTRPVQKAIERSSTSEPAAGAIASIDESGNVRSIAEIEEELIRFALGFYRGQMSQVARKLGIGRSTLYRKLKDYGIDPDDPLKDAA
jgi:DNA-binding NtrC family response regulator